MTALSAIERWLLTGAPRRVLSGLGWLALAVVVIAEIVESRRRA